jgi:hypothetical protein
MLLLLRFFFFLQAALQKKKKDLGTLSELAASAPDTIVEKVYLVDIRCSRRSAATGFHITVDGQVFGPFSRIRYAEPHQLPTFRVNQQSAATSDYLFTPSLW